MRTKYFIESEKKAEPFQKRYLLEPLEKPLYKNRKKNNEKYKNLGNFLEESAITRGVVGMLPVYAEKSGEAGEAWKRIEAKNAYLHECLEQLETAGIILKHFQLGHTASFYSSKQHMPIDDLDKTNLPSKYIVMRFSFSNGEPVPADFTKEIINYPLKPLRPEDRKTTPAPLEFPLDAANRVELRKAIRTATDLQKEIRTALEKRLGKDAVAKNDKYNRLDADITKYLKHAEVFFHIDEIEKSPVSKRSRSDHGRG